MELLLVIAIIGVLVALLLPALQSAKDKARQSVCKSNLKQLGTAFSLYTDAHRGAFPASGSTFYGPHPEDWIWWQTNRIIEKSAIAAFLSTALTKKLLSCPSDTLVRQTPSSVSTNGYYQFSFTFNSIWPTNNSENLGMATIITTNRTALRFRMEQIKSPANKIMLLEEDQATITNGRWTPRANPVTTRHGGKGDAVFADGHVEAITPSTSRDPAYCIPSL